MTQRTVTDAGDDPPPLQLLVRPIIDKAARLISVPETYPFCTEHPYVIVPCHLVSFSIRDLYQAGFGEGEYDILRRTGYATVELPYPLPSHRLVRVIRPLAIASSSSTHISIEGLLETSYVHPSHPVQ